MNSVAYPIGSIALIVALVGCTSQEQFAAPVSFHVPDMMCEEGCAAKVREVLAETPGVKRVSIDFEARMARVDVDKAVFDSDAAIATLVDYGFENSKLVTTR